MMSAPYKASTPDSAGADADDLFDAGHEDFAIADLAGLRSLLGWLRAPGQHVGTLIAASSLILGRKSTTYSAPRYSSVCPFAGQSL